jgi:hypothetical protein
MVLGICLKWYGNSCPIRQSERAGLTKNPPPVVLCAAWDQKLIGILTGATVDGRRQPGWDPLPPQVVCYSRKSMWKGGRGLQGVATARRLTKISQNLHQNIIFCDHIRSSKRFRRCFCKNRYFYYINLIHKNFVQNLTSKLARSTITSPGTIRVKANSKLLGLEFTLRTNLFNIILTDS